MSSVNFEPPKDAMILRKWTVSKVILLRSRPRFYSTIGAMGPKMERTYGDAVAALNSLQTNSAVIDSIRKAGKSLNVQAIPEMIEWCRRAGYEPSDFDRLKPIHIAGTKGKGSTSAFVSTILCQFLPSPSQPESLFHKVGLYTSPHLRFVRERIQINNTPLSEKLFAKYFFETWDRLETSARERGEPTDRSAKPSYFRFLTLMAFHTYMSEGVDTAIVECGIGGEYDSTNIIVTPSVTGITSLGIDHTQLLGNTIEEIAWHKAGIMKHGTPAYTVQQPADTHAVLLKRAAEKGVNLHLVKEYKILQTFKLGLDAPFQRTNASLAINLARSYLETHCQSNPNCPPLHHPNDLPAEFKRGCEQVRWPGRCEIRRERGIAWHIDSGHTLESIRLAASWFASRISSSCSGSSSEPSSSPSSSSSTSAPPPPPPPATTTVSSPASPTNAPRPRLPTHTPRILLFNQQTRDARALAAALHATLAAALRTPHPFTHAVFCTNRTYARGGYRPDLVAMNSDQEAVAALEVQKGLRDAWRAFDGGKAVVEVRGSVEEAVGWVRGVADEERGKWDGEGEGEGEGEVDVLVTGSTHLVGGFLEVLEGGKE